MASMVKAHLIAFACIQLLSVPLCTDSLALPLPTATGMSPKCAISDVVQLPNYEYVRKCEEYIPDSKYTVQHVRVPGDTMQVTEIHQDSDQGPLWGSLDLDYSLNLNDTLLILVNERKMDVSETKLCRRILICNRQLDARSLRLRLNLILAATMSYAVQIFKLAQEAPYLCEMPQVRFFQTNSGTSAQIAVKSCDLCLSAGKTDSDAGTKNVNCQMDMYLNNSTTAAGHQMVRVLPQTNLHKAWINFNEQQPNSSWRRQSFNITLNRDDQFMTVSFYNYTTRGNKKGDLHFFSLTNDKSESLHTQLCRQPLPMADRCVSPTLLTHLTTAADSDVATGSGNPRPLLPGLSLTALLLAAAALTLVVVAYWHLRSRAGRRLLLVFPKSSGRPSTTADRRRFVHLLKELRAADAVKRGRLHVCELTGLRALTPQLARSSRLVVFLSDDQAFSCFPVDELADEPKVLALTEKHRRRAFFISYGQSPAEGTVWHQLSAEHLEENSISKIVKELMALCDGGNW